MAADGLNSDAPIAVQAAEAEDAKAASERFAALEQKGFDTETLEPTLQEKDDHADRRLALVLRFAFFFSALALNLWWDHHVIQLVWQAGRTGAGFHLSDKVLITLLTSSIANFLGLLTIIAHYLFRTAVASQQEGSRTA